MAIVTVKSLDGNDIDSYAVDLYKQLGVGQKKDDRGVLLLVAPNDRRYRVEVGYGLEPVINDARAGDAGRLMAPYFRQGDYSSGITAARGNWRNIWPTTRESRLLARRSCVRSGKKEIPAVWVFGFFWVLSCLFFFCLVPAVLAVISIGVVVEWAAAGGLAP